MYHKYTLNRSTCVVTIIAVCVIGLVTMLASHAATPYASSVASAGILSGSASTFSDTATSFGQAVNFGATTNLLALYHHSVITGTRMVYVEANGGSDTNDGSSQANAYATIQAAVNASKPGDEILVGPGNYGSLSIYGKTNDASHWLSIESQDPTDPATIDVANNSGDDGVDIQESSYVGLFGFQIEGLQTSTDSNNSGVSVFRNSNDIFVWDNNIHDFPGGGVNCFHVDNQVYDGLSLPAGGWDQVDVSFNTIHATSKYSTENTSGISFYGAVDTTNGGTLDGHYGYRAVGNYIYDVLCLVNSDSGAGDYPFVTDGNGISVDSLYVPWDATVSPYSKQGLIEGNIIAGVGGRAVNVFNSINVDGFFNTAVGNLRSNSPAIDGGVEFTSSVVNGNVHYTGNVILPLNTPNTTDANSIYSDNVILGGTQAVPNGNVDDRSVGTSYFSTALNSTNILTGLPVGDFAPLTPTAEPLQSFMTGYQALNNGVQRVGTTSPAGAIN
jgi:hypothetical protein